MPRKPDVHNFSAEVLKGAFVTKRHLQSRGIASLFVICLATRLFATDVDPGLTLPEAAEQGDLKTVRSLVQKSDVNLAQGDGMTALHWAVYHEDLEMASALIKAGTNVNAANRLNAVTPLLIASTAGNAAIIDLLLKSGADANLANSHGTTPLMNAAAAGHLNIVKYLALDCGCQIDQFTPLGITAAFWAAQTDQLDILDFLFQQGAPLTG